jgi:hypothetical protein
MSANCANYRELVSGLAQLAEIRAIRGLNSWPIFPQPACAAQFGGGVDIAQLRRELARQAKGFCFKSLGQALDRKPSGFDLRGYNWQAGAG